MPYVSQAQRNFFHSPTGMRKLGAAEVAKWDAESKGHASNKALPRKVPKRAGDPPGANLNMRPAVAPMRGMGASTSTSGLGFRPIRPIRGAPIKMAKPKGAGKIGIAPAPPGSRSMDRKAPAAPSFGSFVPSSNPFTGQSFARQTQMGEF